MKLQVHNMHYLGKSSKEKRNDLCVHGNIYFEIDGDVICGLESTWCVSASAYRFMKSLKEDHWCDEQNKMIPCCGGLYIPSDDETSVTIVGCDNGIDFDVIRDNNYNINNNIKNIKIITDNKEYILNFTDYKEVVTGFVNEVEKFYLVSEKSYYSNFEKSGFSAFITEWHMLKKSLNIDYNIDIIKDKLTDDFININEQDIIGINKYGITFNNFVFFEFKQDLIDPIGDILIGKNYCLVIYGKIYNKDIELNIVFNKDKFFTKGFRSNKTCKRFNELSSKIESYGYKLNKII